MSIIILYTDYSYPIYKDLLAKYKRILPANLTEKLFKFRRWQDRQAFLIGKLLLWKGLKQLKYDDNCLTKLHFNNYGKPYIDQINFFNLSHSGNYVICAFYKEEIGIDIEEIKELEIENFKSIFTEQEKSYLKASPKSLKDFFRFWTIKESVIKAEGKGLSIPLQQINASNRTNVVYDQKVWHIMELDLFQNCCCSIATKLKDPSVTLTKVEFNLWNENILH